MRLQQTRGPALFCVLHADALPYDTSCTDCVFASLSNTFLYCKEARIERNIALTAQLRPLIDLI